MLPDEPGTIVMPNVNYFPNRQGAQALYIVLHGTAGMSRAQDIATYFQSTQYGSNPVTSHYVIGQDGTIVQCVPESGGAWANGALTSGHDAFWDTVCQVDPATGIPAINPNNVVIAIEHCKPDGTNQIALTPAQQNASFRLIEHICKRRNIPMKYASDSTGGITGHFSLDPVNRSRCPGNYPWDALWAHLNGVAQTTGNTEEDIVITLNDVAQFFVQAPGNAWKCKQTGMVIGNAILDYYRNYGKTALCGLTYLGLPITNEFSVPGHSGVTFQRFERAVLCYDPQNQLDRTPGEVGPVYMAHLYEGYAQDPRLDKLQAQVITLQNQLKTAQQSANDQAVADLKTKLKQINALSSV